MSAVLDPLPTRDDPVQTAIESAAPWTVEEFLDRIDYAEDPGYVPSDFALDFVTFIKLVNGDRGEENLTPVVHYRMLDTIAARGRRIVNLCARGLAKTTLMGEYLFLYIGTYGELPGFGRLNLALYVSDSIENGVKNMRKNLEHRWENSEFLREYIPQTRFTDVRWEFRNADGHLFVVRGYGAKTGVRGTKEMGQRPQLAVLDDLISDEDARSDTVIAAVEDTVHKAVTYALHPTKNIIIWSGTPFNAKDPLYKAINSGAWQVNVFPVCEEFPCTRAEFRGAWPDRFTFDYVKLQYDTAIKQGRVDTFNQELMLRIMSEEDRMVLDDDLRWYERALVLGNRDRFNFYMTTDFATSTKQRADFSVIAVWAYNNNGDWFFVDGERERQLMDKNVDAIFNYVSRFRPQQVGVEVSGQQQGFVAWLEKEMLVRNVFFTLAKEKGATKPGIRPNTNKMERFNVVLPLFKAGKVFFPIEMKSHPILQAFLGELALVSRSGFKSKHDDCLDTISMLGSLSPWRPSQEQPMVQNPDSHLWEDMTPAPSATRLGSYIV